MPVPNQVQHARALLRIRLCPHIPQVLRPPLHFTWADSQHCDTPDYPQGPRPQWHGLTKPGTWLKTHIPVRTKAEQLLLAQFARAWVELRFPLRGIHSDMGGEFINRQLYDYCSREHPGEIEGGVGSWHGRLETPSSVSLTFIREATNPRSPIFIREATI